MEQKRPIAYYRQSNSNRIYKLIYEQGCMSKPEIAHHLELSLPTVQMSVKRMQEEGLLEETGTLETSGTGRRPVAVSCVKDAYAAIGIDITLHHIKAVMVGIDGEDFYSIYLREQFENTDEYARKIGAVVEQLLADTSFPTERVLGVGISIPGITSHDGSIMISSNKIKVRNLLCSDIAKYIIYPCFLTNDANAAGVAEMWIRKELQHVAYIALSDTVGGSVILNRKLCEGDNQRSGEFGHIMVHPGGRLCHCGRKGCLSAYCSANILMESTKSSLDEFFKELESGNTRLEPIWDEYLKDLAIGITQMRMILDCDVVLGGYVGAYMEKHLTRLQREVQRLSPFGDKGEFIQTCRYKKSASAVGAALPYIEKFIDEVGVV